MQQEGDEDEDVGNLFSSSYMSNEGLIANMEEKNLIEGRCTLGACLKRKRGPEIAVPGFKFCIKHKCSIDGCGRMIQSAKLCQAHGGGKRCDFEGCLVASRDGTGFCTTHGGGKPCATTDCQKLSIGAPIDGKYYCRIHGGGKRCALSGCNARAGASSKWCSSHGGKDRCKRAGCDKARQGSGLCISHGGGKVCKVVGCTKLRQSRRQGMCWSHFKAANSV